MTSMRQQQAEPMLKLFAAASALTAVGLFVLPFPID
jgi:hypothetical protein